MYRQRIHLYVRDREGWNQVVAVANDLNGMAERLNVPVATLRRYGPMFARNLSLHATVTARLRAGEWTVDEEHVTIDGVARHLLVGYQVVDRLIRNVVMMRSDPM